MENLLQGIPHVIVRMDDILISGKDDNNHLANLEAVAQEIVSSWAEAWTREVLLRGAGSHLLWLRHQWVGCQTCSS